MAENETVEDIFTDAWRPHVHPELEGELGKMQHVHAPAATFAVSFGVPMNLRHDDDVDLVEILEFRGAATSMQAAMEEQRAVTDLSELPLAKQQLTIIGWNADMMVLESVLALTGQVLEAHDLPPAFLQPVESSNIRSIGWLGQADEADEDDLFSTESKGELFVAFLNGKLYRYAAVPLGAYIEVIEADSVGAAFAHYIRKAGYEFTQVS